MTHRILSSLILACLLPAPLLAQWQSLQSIRSAAEQFVQAQHAGRNASVEAGYLDPRLRLAACDGRLEAFQTSQARRSGNATVGVRCSGTQHWKLYVPVRTVIRSRVVVAAQSLSRGDTLRQQDLTWAEHDINRLPYGFVDDVSSVVGQVLKRPLAPGTVLIPTMLDRQQLIRRGQQVNVVSAASGVKITMAGTALADGALQQRIKVQNRSSGRILEGIVLSAETVEIR